MAVQSQIPRLQTPAAAADIPAPSTRSTHSPGPSTRTTPSPDLKSTPKSKIPSRPSTPSSSPQSRLGWKPTAHWKPPAYARPISDSPSNAGTSRLPRLIPWLTSKASRNQPSAPRVSSPSSSSRDSATLSRSTENDSPSKDKSKSKRDWKETWWGDSGASLLELMHAQNPDVDRSPAVVGEPDNSKRYIRLLNPYGVPIGDSQDPVAQMVYPKTVDWCDGEEVNGLNKWRKAVFEHYLGPAQVEEMEWHPLEDEFVVREVQCWENAGKELPSWAKVTRDFNRRFEGRRSGADSRLRSKVTREMLRKRYIELVRRGSCFTAAIDVPKEMIDLTVLG